MGQIMGGKRTPTAESFKAMHSRCYYPKNKDFKNYGGRGIKVVRRWHKFKNFLNDMGARPKRMTLDRINSNRDYSPKNCRWATRYTQANNQRTNKYKKIGKTTKSVTQWAAVFKIKKATVFSRLWRGWDIVDALNAPLKKNGAS